MMMTAYWLRMVPICTAAAGGLLACTSSAQIMSPVAGDPVTIDTGQVAGTRLGNGLKAYFGIPFAAPPVRENRWREPQPVTPWSGIYTADAKRAECVQGLRSSNINHYFGEEDAAEDCLYLNIWAPGEARRGTKLPVVVWIYGGAFVGGSSSSPIYAGDALAQKGVIYVAFNYRLGLFGFLAHPQLTRESGHNASGNWGFLDQVAALKWVQRNIVAFGGDPDNVTLVGQSAGSMSINNLQASPMARGLFRRVFGMSGATVQGGAGAGVPLKQAEAEGLKLQTAMKAKDLAGMRAFSSDKVTAFAQRVGVRPAPAVDGYYLPDSVDAIFNAGRQSDVPVVTGSTADDIGTATPIRGAKMVAEYRQLAAQSFGAKAAEFLKLWPASGNATVRGVAEEVGRNSGFALGARSWARLQTATGKQPAYLFMVTRVQPFTPGVSFGDFNTATAGAYHMGDVPYFLGTYEAFNLFRRTRDWTPLDRSLSEEMQNVLVTYARTGVPSTPRARFVRYDPANEQRTDFGDRIAVEKINGRGMDFLLANAPSPSAPSTGRPAARREDPNGPDATLPASTRY
jgi:para-nitrobenzyl esterase